MSLVGPLWDYHVSSKLSQRDPKCGLYDPIENHDNPRKLVGLQRSDNGSGIGIKFLIDLAIDQPPFTLANISIL